MALGARGQAVALLLALPVVVGLLRIFAPPALTALGGIKPGTCRLLTASYLLLLGLPAVAILLPTPQSPRLFWLIALVSVHQLIEYLGTVGLWAWLGDIVPPRIRGRYLGRRQFWQLAAQIPVLIVAAVFATYWRNNSPFMSGPLPLLGYLTPIFVGNLFLLASVIPLYYMPAPRIASIQNSRQTGHEFYAPLKNQRFRRLLVYGCWLAFFNGITQSAQNFYTSGRLGIEAGTLLLLQTMMRFGQLGLRRPSGWLADRLGNRPVMLVSQAVVATAPLFFLMAAYDQPWWIIGAWLVWSAFAGLNICLPNLNIKFSTPETRPATFAMYYALTSAAYAVSTLFGGIVYDAFRYEYFEVGPWVFDVFGFLFYIALVTRMTGLVFILGIDEPGSRPLLSLIRPKTTSLEKPALHPLDLPN